MDNVAIFAQETMATAINGLPSFLNAGPALKKKLRRGVVETALIATALMLTAQTHNPSTEHAE